MKTIKLKYCILLTGLLMFSGCSESFLDVTQRGVQNMDDFYQTDEQALQTVGSVYDYIQQAGLASTYLDVLADDCVSGSTNLASNQWWNFGFDPSASAVSYLFGYYYDVIYRANVVINRVSPDTELKAMYVAEAKAFRAMYYIQLVMLWGTPPLVTSELDPSEYYQSNTSADKIWAQIEQDLTEAMDVLPLKSEQSAQGRMSKGAAMTLLGKAYLYQEKYSEAAEVLDEVIESDEYSLWPDFAKVHREISELGSESIFEICNIRDSEHSETQEAGFLYMMKVVAPRSGYFTEGNTGIDAGWGYYQPMACLYDDFVNWGDTYRRQYTVLNEADVEAMDGSLRTSEGIYQYSTELCIRYKLTNFNDEVLDVNGTTYEVMSCPTNLRYIRYADALLMAAEAHNRKSVPDDTKALEYVNEVRARATGLDPLTITGNDLFEAIKMERRLEFAYEGFRYIDLIRWGDAADVLGDKGASVANGDGTFITYDTYGFVEGKHNLLPFPEQELIINPNITQNPNW